MAYAVRMQKVRIIAGVLCVLFLALSSGCATTRPPAGARPVDRNMEVTGYCKCKKCCGWKRTWYGRAVDVRSGKHKRVGITASGHRAKEGLTIAADLSQYPLGTVIQVPGYGYGRVQDKGSAITRDRLDLYFKSHHRALQWGRRKMTVRIWETR